MFRDSDIFEYLNIYCKAMEILIRYAGVKDDEYAEVYTPTNKSDSRRRAAELCKAGPVREALIRNFAQILHDVAAVGDYNQNARYGDLSDDDIRWLCELLRDDLIACNASLRAGVSEHGKCPETGSSQQGCSEWTQPNIFGCNHKKCDDCYIATSTCPNKYLHTVADLLVNYHEDLARDLIEYFSFQDKFEDAYTDTLGMKSAAKIN
jgi:hypothetical protein